ncbi:Cdc2-related protein kinase [Pseudoloma neurophilia]|uniref:Cdc2-related protein kinase n=1 Tax=Pseudoloma neurophilia TaxID=146866 RepID=A0A0R0M514_9MICR|nr:Cdc2-related protein kinase [Pseudoloma neurophilia]
MNNFEGTELIGEGTFGKVYRGNYKTERTKKCAIKKIPMEKGGMSVITIRELQILKRYSNKNILKLYDAYIHESDFYMVLEYLPFDLSALFLSKYIFSDNQIKSLMFQLLQGLSFLHSECLIHRDIKSSNILLSKSGELKIADFGLSKVQSKSMTNQVCTLWYRAPELLLGQNEYDHKIDTWAAGCIFIEFKTFTPYFCETKEIPQIKRILSLLGAPKQDYKYNSLLKVKQYIRPEPFDETISKLFGNFFNPEMLELLTKMIQLDFHKRISCTDTLNLPFFDNFQDVYFPIQAEDVHDTIIRTQLKEKSKKVKTNQKIK